MEKRVVGWHFKTQPIVCDFCGQLGSDVLVEYVHDGYHLGSLMESCNKCTPPKSCRDEIHDILEKAIKR